MAIPICLHSRIGPGDWLRTSKLRFLRTEGIPIPVTPGWSARWGTSPPADGFEPSRYAFPPRAVNWWASRDSNPDSPKGEHAFTERRSQSYLPDARKQGVSTRRSHSPHRTLAEDRRIERLWWVSHQTSGFKPDCQPFSGILG